MSTPVLDPHFFRHEYGRLVAVLSRHVGVQHVEAVEDAVQSALMTAVESWTLNGLPDDPSAWLYRVALNRLTGELRQTARRRQILGTQGPAPPSQGESARFYLAGEVHDDLLRMLFACCDEALPETSQLVLALKTLCGFSVPEIAHRLFSSEANVYKRLTRARSRLRERPSELGELDGAQQVARLPGVHKILYLLFTEGYLSSHQEHALRLELCDEALRLCHLLAQHPVGRTPETFALLSLMHLHLARITARQDSAGGLLLLEEQDRGLWDAERIQVGLEWLARSAQGERFSRYHAEAGIAAEHCLAPSFRQTRWDKVVECYALLEELAPSPLHRLNRAVATAEWQGAARGLAVLEDFDPPTWLKDSYQYAAVLADLHKRAGHRDAWNRHRAQALASAPNSAIKQLLERRLATND